jgi:hypothetical protein
LTNEEEIECLKAEITRLEKELTALKTAPINIRVNGNNVANIPVPTNWEPGDTINVTFSWPPVISEN